MIVLDTNIVSELLRPEPAVQVAAWSDALTPSEVFLTSVTRAELRAGIALLPSGAKRVALEHMVEQYVVRMADRTLPFENAAADRYAEILAERRRVGHPISHPDAQVAAIARARGATVATRNTRDFEGTGVKIINPWDAT